MKKASYDTQAFTVGYDVAGSLVDETESAIIISNYLGLKHKTIVLHSDSISQDIDRVMWFLDEPHYSTVSISTYNLAKTACQYVKGVLTGDGSDELFLSYNYLRCLLENPNNNDEDILNSYIEQIGWLSTTHKMNLLDTSLYFNGQDYITEFFKPQDTILDTVRYFEMRYRLPDYHLARVDKLTMAVGLEARVPFLRKSMIEWSAQKSSMDLLQYNQSKAYLKKELSHYLPTKILRQQKKPFTTPMYHWLKITLKEEVYDLFNIIDYTNSLGLNRTYLLSLAEDFYQKDIDNSKILWGVYLLLKWYKNVSDTKKYLL
jgi:asparagine synthase (glutamine-hydrolysing)